MTDEAPGVGLAVRSEALARKHFRSEALDRLRAGVLGMDDQVDALVAAGATEALAEGGQDLQALIGDLEAVQRKVRVELAKLVDARADQDRLDAWEEKHAAWEEKVAEIQCRHCSMVPSAHRDDGSCVGGETAYHPRRRPPPEPLRPEIKATGRKQTVIDGVGVIESNGGFTRTNWRSRELLRELLVIALADLSIFTPDGEDAHDVAYENLMDVLCEALPITASLSWRTGKWAEGDNPPTGLKRWGINDTDWCDREEKVRLATIPRLKGSTR